MLKENDSTTRAHNFGAARSNNLLRVAAWACVFAVSLPLEARAYTDPGTGTFLLQMLLAAIAGGLFFMRTLRYRIKMLFKRNRNNGAAEGGDRNDN